MMLTEVDIRNSKLLGVLMMAAKLLDEAARDQNLPAEEAAIRASKGYGSLMQTALKLFPKYGELEAATLALGRQLGFQIEQQVVTPGNNQRN